MSATKYPLPMRLFHWTISVLVIFMIILGLLLANGLDKSDNGVMWVNLHKSVGVLILLLVVGRMLSRLNYRKVIPILAPTLPFYERWLAKTVHVLLYGFLFIMPLTGYIMVSLNPKSTSIPFFGLELPVFLPKNEALGKLFFEFHEVSAFILIALIALHLAGVVKHRFFDRPEHDSLRKML